MKRDEGSTREAGNKSNKTKKKKRKNALADRYLSSILDQQQQQGSPSTRLTARTEPTVTDDDSCCCSEEDQVFIDRPRAPRRSPEDGTTTTTSVHRRIITAPPSLPWSRRDATTVVQREKQTLLMEELEGGVQSNSCTGGGDASSSSRVVPTSSLDQVMEKGLDMIMTSTNCGTTTGTSPSLSSSAHPATTTAASSSIPLDDTKKKFQSVQQRFWDVGRIVPPAAAQASTPKPRPVSPTASELTGAPTEIATNRAVDVAMKRRFEKEEEQMHRTTRQEGVADDSGILIMNNSILSNSLLTTASSSSVRSKSGSTHEQHTTDDDASRGPAGLNNNTAPASVVMHKRTFRVATTVDVLPCRVKSPRSAAAAAQPDPIFSSKSFHESGSVSEVPAVAAAVELPMMRTSPVPPLPAVVANSNSDTVRYPPEKRPPRKNSVAPIERIKAARHQPQQATTTTNSRDNLAPIERIKQTSNTRRRKSLADMWSDKHNNNNKTATKPTTLVLDGSSSVGADVQSIRSIFESKLNNNNTVENDDDDDEASISVKSLRSVFENRGTPQDDTGSVVRSICQVYEPTTTSTTKKQQQRRDNDDAVGKLKALFDDTKQQSQTTTPSPSKRRSVPKVWTPVDITVPPSSLAGTPPPVVPKKKRPSKGDPPARGRNSRVLGWWQDKSSDDQSRQSEDKPVQANTTSKQVNDEDIPEQQSREDGDATRSQVVNDRSSSSCSISVVSSSRGRSVEPTWMGHRGKVLSRHSGSIGHSFLSFEGGGSGCLLDNKSMMSSSQQELHVEQSRDETSPPPVMESSDSSASVDSGFSDGVTLDASITEVSVLTDPTGVASSKLEQQHQRESKIPRRVLSKRQRSPHSGRVQQQQQGVSPTKSHSVASSSQPSEAAVPLISEILRRMPYSDEMSGHPTAAAAVKRVWSQDTGALSSLASVGQNVAYGYSSLSQDDDEDATGWDLHRVEALFPTSSTLLIGDDHDRKLEAPSVWEVFPSSPDIWLDEVPLFSSSAPLSETSESEINEKANLRLDPPGEELVHRSPLLDDLTPVVKSLDSSFHQLDSTSTASPPLQSSVEDAPLSSPDRVPVLQEEDEVTDYWRQRTTTSRFPSETRQEVTSAPPKSTSVSDPGPQMSHASFSSRFLMRHRVTKTVNAPSPSKSWSEGVGTTTSSLSSRVAQALQRQREARIRKRSEPTTTPTKEKSLFNAEVESISTTPLSMVAQAARRKKKNKEATGFSPLRIPHDVESDIYGDFPRTPPRRPPVEQQNGRSPEPQDFWSPGNETPPRMPSEVKSPSSLSTTPTRTNTSKRGQRSMGVPDFPLFILDMEDDGTSQQYLPASVASSGVSVHSRSSAPSPQFSSAPLHHSPKKERSAPSSLVGVPGETSAPTYLPKYAALRTRLRTLRASRLRRTVAKSGYVASPKGVIEEQVASQAFQQATSRPWLFANEDEIPLQMPFNKQHHR